MEFNFSGLIAYFIIFMQYPLVINPLPIKLSSNILNSKFNNNILNTLITNLMPNFNYLKFLDCKV